MTQPAGTPQIASLDRTLAMLEAYCSGIGKVLLANLSETERHAYLACGPFVALTPRTMTDPAVLAQALDHVRAQGFASDEGEIAPDLRCLAMPIHTPDGRVPAAISVSQLTGRNRGLPPAEILPLLIAEPRASTPHFGPIRTLPSGPRHTCAARRSCHRPAPE